MLTLVGGSDNSDDTPDTIVDLDGATRAALENLRTHIETLRQNSLQRGLGVSPHLESVNVIELVQSVDITEQDILTLPGLNPYLFLIASWQIHPDTFSNGRHELVRHIAQVCQPLSSYKNATQFKTDKNYRGDLLQATILDKRIERLMYELNGHEDIHEDLLMSRLRLAACGGLAMQGKKIPMRTSMLLRGNDRRALSVMTNGAVIASFDGTPIPSNILSDAIEIGMKKARAAVRHVADEAEARVGARKEALVTDGVDERFAARRADVDDERLVAESRTANMDSVDYESLLSDPELLRRVIRTVFPGM